MEWSDDHLNFKATELRLGLPGSEEPEKVTCTIAKNNKRASQDVNEECTVNDEKEYASLIDTQSVGWPPIRSYGKSTMQITKKDEAEKGGAYVKVSVDGAPYLRKIDLKVYKSYPELLRALENLFKFTIGKYSEREGYGTSDYAPTYEDNEGDWMLVGDVPWNMFVTSCKRLRIIKG